MTNVRVMMNMLHILLCSFSAPSEWTILRYGTAPTQLGIHLEVSCSEMVVEHATSAASGGQAQGRSLLEDTSSFILAPQGFPSMVALASQMQTCADQVLVNRICFRRTDLDSDADVTTINQALHNRSDVLQRTIASSRATDPVQSSFEGTGMGRSKSITTVTSAAFIACLGLLTFIVLTWARRHLEQRRARGEHVIDGSEYANQVPEPYMSGEMSCTEFVSAVSNHTSIVQAS